MTTIKTHKNKNGIEYYSTFNEDGEKIFSFSPSFDDIWSQEDQDEEHRHEIKLAAIYSPGKAVFGDSLLDLTAKAWDIGVNLSGAEIRKAWPSATGGIWVSGGCEDKHYSANGNVDN